jgi:CubicO group peptidase (beta-lactamase class C family)
MTDRGSLVLDDLLPAQPDAPGIAVTIMRGGEVVERHCTGLASLEHRVPIRPETRFHIVSVTKTYTAAAILILAARGALGLDDDIRRHLPELKPPADGAPAVTIRHLLSMTSGLRGVLEVERLRGIWRPSPSRAADLLDLALRQEAVSLPAGTAYLYANVNFVLLEEIIRRVAGMDADSFRHAVLYEPLGLVSTGARPHDGLVLPNLAEPYVPAAAGGWQRATDLLGIAGDTLTTSSDDLACWLRALRDGTIEGVAITGAMAQPALLRDGKAIHYGLGLAIRRYRGLRVLCHSGSQPGYKAHIAYVPERDLAIAVLSNREDTRASALAAAIMERAIGAAFPAPHPMTIPAGRLAAAPLGAAQIAAIPGDYVDAATGEWLSLSIEDGVLAAETLGDPITFYHVGAGVFRDGDDYRATVPAELRFDFAEETSCFLWLGGLRCTLRKDAPPRYDSAALQQFCGRFESAEIASRHEISAGPAGLTVQYGIGFDRGLSFALQPIAPDVFLARPSAPGVAHRHVFRFERDATGHVVAALVTMERLKGIRLPRCSRAPDPG